MARTAQLSERVILDAALRLTRAVGVEQLTMRALADELGASTMATYHYVRSRDALLLLVADEVMRPVAPPPASGAWDERLWVYMQRMAEALASYPGLTDFLLQHDATPESRRYMEGCIRILRDGGFDAEQAKQAFGAVYTFMWGWSVFQGVRNRRRATGAPARRSRQGALPTVEELASTRSIETGYRALVHGLAHTLPSVRPTG